MKFCALPGHLGGEEEGFSCCSSMRPIPPGPFCPSPSASLLPPDPFRLTPSTYLLLSCLRGAVECAERSGALVCACRDEPYGVLSPRSMRSGYPHHPCLLGLPQSCDEPSPAVYLHLMIIKRCFVTGLDHHAPCAYCCNELPTAGSCALPLPLCTRFPQV